MLMLAVLAGVLAGLGSPLLLAPVVIVIGVVASMLFPAHWQITALIVYSMAVVGPAVFFAHIESARWVSPVLAFSLLLPLTLKIWVPVRAKALGHAAPAFMWVLLVFVLHVAFTTLVNEPSLGEALNTPRYYLAIAPLVLLLMVGAFNPDQFERTWRLLVWFTVVQLPVAAVQHFVYAARKVREASWDAVVGTFPGQSEGGGASHGLGVYMLTAIVFAFSLWQKGYMRGRSVAFICVSAIGTVMLAEVKAVVILIPVALVLTFASALRRHMFSLVLSAIVGLGLVVAVFAVYDRVFYEEARTTWQYTDAPTTAMEGVRNQLDPGRVTLYAPPSRAASFVQWWDRHARPGDVMGMLIGHGGAATQANRVGVGELVRKYSEPLQQTTTSMLLWETGLVGHALVVLALLMAARTASKLAADNRVPNVQRALLHASSVGLVLHTLTLPYKSFVLLTAPSQVLLGLLLGFVAYWARQSARPAKLT
jgi:hypothetical protein